MAEPLAGFHPLDPGRVDFIDTWERAYWCRELHCTEGELRAAVAQAGTHVAAVREVLELRRKEGRLPGSAQERP